MIALFERKILSNTDAVTSYFCDGWERKGLCWVEVRKVSILWGLITYYTFSSGVPKVFGIYDNREWAEYLKELHKSIKTYCKKVITRIKLGEIDEDLVQDVVRDEFESLIYEY